MEAELRISGGDAVSELASLSSWLQLQRELQGRIRPVRRTPAPNELGGAVELLTVALGSGGALGMVLARAVSTWLTNRRSDVSVTVSTEVGTVTVEAKRVSDPMPFLQEVLRHRVADVDET